MKHSSFLYHCCIFLTRLIFRCGCRVHVVMLEEPPLKGACILASNHISHFDPTLLSSFFPRVLDWIAMEELFRNRWSARFFSRVHLISVDRFGKDLANNRQALRTILKRLALGRTVAIFPEGGIRAHESSILENAPMKSGLAALSLLAQAPVIPCVVLGTDRLYVGKNWLRRRPLWIIIGKAIVPPKLHGAQDKKKREDFQQELSMAFPTLKQELCTRFHLRPEDLPQTPQERRAV